jgi:hypothetical protein
MAKIIIGVLVENLRINLSVMFLLNINYNLQGSHQGTKFVPTKVTGKGEKVYLCNCKYTKN